MGSDDFDIRVLCLGAGVQSTALYLMALDGELPFTVDAAIFGDTQQEPPWVMENVIALAKEGGGEIPISVVTYGDLGDSLRRQTGYKPGRFASVPFWVKTPTGRGSGRRQCTREYKIDMVTREIRNLLGLKKGARASGRFRAEEWVGISLDEASRAKPSRHSWITTRWPFLFDRPMRRNEIMEWLKARGWPDIKKSACVACPYRHPLEWDRWRTEEPDLFEKACVWDDEIRHSGDRLGERRGMRGEQYILDTLTSLRELPNRDTLMGRNDVQLNMFENECDGYCGV